MKGKGEPLPMTLTRKGGNSVITLDMLDRLKKNGAATTPSPDKAATPEMPKEMMAMLAPIWALVEWQDNGGFERFAFGDTSTGSWEPWILYVAIVWGFVVAIDAVKTYFDRPTTEARIERELERLRSGR